MSPSTKTSLTNAENWISRQSRRILGALVCIAQMLALPLDTWLRLLGWMAIGIVIYFTYSIRRSKLNQPGEKQTAKF